MTNATIKLLDLYSGAGGAAHGYHRAGFTVTGIDCRPQPRYPYAFIQADAVACHHTRGVVHVTINGEERAVTYPVLCTGGADGPRSGKRHPRPRQPVAEVRWAMELPWMTQAELSEAIPPAYTHWLGARLIDALTGRTSV